MKYFKSASFALYGFLLVAVLFFVYSFTQIDLSLAFSQSPLLQNFVKTFQYIGYFNRALSAQLFIYLTILLFIFYLLLLDRIREKKIAAKKIWIAVAVVAVLFTMSYNAFSYDLFNYIFDAKIVTHYHENPYVKKALDFPRDPMLSFMRWTHRVYPYGPVWLALTVPLSYLGMQKFIITFVLFKFLMTASFIGTVYFLYQLLKKLTPSHAVYGTAFFALNPLVLTESLISAHNDIVMLCLAVVSFLFLSRKNFPVALLFLALSIGIKFATVFLLPAFLWVIYRHIRKKEIDWERVTIFILFLMIGAVIAVSLRTNFQPWYLLYVLPFAAVLSDKKYILIPTVFISLSALLNYLPFLFTGNWDPPIPLLLNVIMGVGIVLSLPVILSALLRKRQIRASK
jgi:hypothetical protein